MTGAASAPRGWRPAALRAIGQDPALSATTFC